jgi:hypothetical protein
MLKQTLFVLAFANDAVTTTVLSYEVAMQLEGRRAKYIAGLPTDKASGESAVWIMPEPAWTLSDYATQCQNDSEHTLGALIVYDVENDAGVFNYILYQHTYTHLYAKAFFVSCEPFAPPFSSAGTNLTTYTQQITFTGSPKSASLDKVQPGPLPVPKPPPDSVGPAAAALSATQSYATPNPKPAGAYPTQDIKTTPAESQIIATQTSTVIPRMRVVWHAASELHDFAHQASVPFIGIAAVGAYLASRTSNEQKTVTQTQPLIPGTPTANGLITISTQKTSNNSTLPYGVALVGSALTPLASVTFGGANQTRILKNAASGVATKLYEQIAMGCKAGTQDRPANLCTAAGLP